jgi:Holliday junction resolvasome RuvABC endonuclease subunit
MTEEATGPVIVGVDPASVKSVAVVLHPDRRYEIHIHKTKAKDMPTRSLESFRWMRRIVRSVDGPVVVYLERPVFARGGLKALLPLGETQGALAAGAASAGATVVRVTPPMWKKSVIGNGAASKLKIKMYLKKLWAAFYLESDGDIDVCDAGAIAIYGRKQHAPTKGVKRVRVVGGNGKPVRRADPGRAVHMGVRPGKGVPAVVSNPAR